MSTRSAIIVKKPEGATGIHCHFDGYPEHVGAILEKHYNTPEKADELVALGDIFSLFENVNPPNSKRHTYDNPVEGVTIAYHRDRGEEFNQAKGATVHEVEKQIEHNGYVYVFDGTWTCNGLPIADAIRKEDL